MNNNYLDSRPKNGSLKDFRPLEIIMVNKTEYEPVWDYMVKNYHYLGYEKMIGRRIKYLIKHSDNPIAAISFNQASLKLEARDRFINWAPNQRKHLLKHVVNNNRFLILPWVKVRYLASHILSRTLKLLKKDWVLMYDVEPYLVETFVDKDKYKGTCYYAANFKYLGRTKGYGKVGKAFVYHGNKKSIFIYELKKGFDKVIDTIACHRPQIKRCKRVPKMMINTPVWDPAIIEDAGINEGEVGKLHDMLKDYLCIYDSCFPRSEARTNANIFITGLLTDLERKSIEPIALELAGEKAVRPIQLFFNQSPIDYAKMHGIYQHRLSDNISEEDGMTSVDGSDFAKKGNKSVGVARQYCGSLGKKENCQAGVFTSYASTKGYGLLDCALYMPKLWFDEEHAKLRKECNVPEDLEFKTKVQIASDMINKAEQSGLFKGKWIGCDSYFGRSREFLSSLPEDKYYFADIPNDTLIWLQMPVVAVPEYSGRGPRPKKKRASTKPINVSKIAKDDSIPWKKATLGEGAKGPIIAKVKCVRVITAHKDEKNQLLPDKEVWLYIRKNSSDKIKYAISNAPADIERKELNRAAILRWPIEQCFKECKSNLGMGHYETRSWNAWHRHMLFVFIAHLFVLEIRLRFKKNTFFNNATS